MRENRGSFYIILAFSFITIGGIVMYPRMMLLYPEGREEEKIFVLVPCQALEADRVEKEVTSVIEAVIAMIPGIKLIQSTTTTSMARISLSLKTGEDPVKMRYRISNALREIIGRLPSYTAAPRVIIHDSEENICLLSYFLYGDPADIEVYASPDRYFKNTEDGVKISVTKPAETSFTIKQYIADDQYLPENNIMVDPGKPGAWGSDQNHENMDVNHEVRFRPLNARPISHSPGKMIWYAGDLLDDRWMNNDEIIRTRVNGKEAVMLSIYIEGRENIYLKGREVRQGFLKIMDGSHRSGVVCVYDLVAEISDELRIFRNNLFLVLAGFFLLIPFGLRYFLGGLISGLLVPGTILFVLAVTGTVVTSGSLDFIVAGHAMSVPWTFFVSYGLKKNEQTRATSSIISTSVVVCLTISGLLTLCSMESVGDIRILGISILVSGLTASFLFPAIQSMFPGEGKSNDPGTRIVKKKILSTPNLQFTNIIRLSTLAIVILLNISWEQVTFLTKKNRELSFRDIFAGGVGAMDKFRDAITDRSQHGEPGSTLTMLYRFPPGIDLHDADSLVREFESILDRYSDRIHYITIFPEAGMASVEIRARPGSGGREIITEIKDLLIRTGLNKGGVTWHIVGAGKSYHSAEDEIYDPDFKLRMTGYDLARLREQERRVITDLQKNPRVVAFKESPAGYSNHVHGDIIERFYLVHPFREQTVKKLLASTGSVYMNTILGSVQLNPQGDGHISRYEFNELVTQEEILRDPGYKPASVIQRSGQQYINEISVKYLGLASSAKKYLSRFIQEQEQVLPAGYHLSLASNGLTQDDDVDIYRILIIVISMTFMFLSVLSESMIKPVDIMILLAFIFTITFLVLHGLAGWSGSRLLLMILSTLVASLSILIFLSSDARSSDKSN